MDGLLETNDGTLALPIWLVGIGGFVSGVVLTFLLARRGSTRSRDGARAPDAPPSPAPSLTPETSPLSTDSKAPTAPRESVGALAGGVAHDFHNLLTVILAHVDRAADRLPPEHDARSILGDVLAPVREAAGLTRALLRLTQDPTGEQIEIDVVSLTRDSVRLLRRLLPASVTLRESFPTRPLWIRDDPTRIQRLLVDFVVQARDAAPAGGPITLQLLHETSGEREEAVLRVEDSRGGIGDREARFPLGATREGRPPAPRTAPPARAEGELVMVAEDDEFVREILITALEDAGYRVESAVDGPDALAIAERARDELRLAILDVDLPGHSGPTIRNELRARAPDLPILFVTGGGFAAEPLALGDDPVLEKPFTMERLVRTAHDILHSPDRLPSELP